MLFLLNFLSMLKCVSQRRWTFLDLILVYMHWQYFSVYTMYTIVPSLHAIVKHNKQEIKWYLHYCGKNIPHNKWNKIRKCTAWISSRKKLFFKFLSGSGVPRKCIVCFGKPNIACWLQYSIHIRKHRDPQIWTCCAMLRWYLLVDTDNMTFSWKTTLQYVLLIGNKSNIWPSLCTNSFTSALKSAQNTLVL